MPNLTIPNGLILESNEFTLGSLGDLPMATIVYLLSNGFGQSMTDAGTTASAKARNGAIKEAEKTRGKMNAAAIATFIESPYIATLLEEAAYDARKKRMQALAEGTMVYGARGPNGPRRNALEAFLFACALADAGKDARAKGKTLPTDKEGLNAILARYIAARRDDYEARFNTTTPADAGDLLGDL